MLECSANNEREVGENFEMCCDNQGKGEEFLNNQETSNRKSLEDERRTAEVLRDLGLSKNGPFF